MKTLRTSVDQFIQGELDPEALTVQIERSFKDSPEEAKLLVEHIKRLSQESTVTAESAARLEDTLILIKTARTKLAPQTEDSTRTTPDSHETQLSPQSSSELTNRDSEPLGIGSIVKERFELVEVLGRGGMGIVYKAKDQRKVEARDRNPYIALKVLSEDFKKNPDSFIALQREARKCQDLAHPNIVTVYDFDKDDTHVYMTMECLNGKPLSTLMSQPEFSSKPMEQRWAIISQIGRGLSYAHEQNIIHSDLKPGNIFVNDTGVVKILDFGIARAAKSSEQKRGDTTIFDPGDLNCLTPAYASCEMFENQPPDIRDDIYAFGCVAYGALTGNHPYNRLPSIQARKNGLSPQLIKGLNRKQWKALQQTLAFDRNSRTSSINQFLIEWQSEPENPRTRYLWLLGLIFFTIVIFTGVYFYETKEIDTPPIVSILLSPEDQEKTTRLLGIAELHFSVGRIVEPPGSNAMFAFKEVLRIDPSNKKATTGLRNIAEDLAKQGRQLLDNGEKEMALAKIEAGLKAEPKHRLLRRLLKKAKN